MIDTKKIRNKHGFTLVEIIVVLVILAIRLFGLSMKVRALKDQGLAD